MISKKNSNSQNKNSNLLIRQTKTSSKLRLDKKCRQVNLQNKDLTSVSGIQQCLDVRDVKLSNNNIQDFEGLVYLKSCNKIETIRIQRNPICNKINFMYGISAIIGKSVEINQCHVKADWAVLQAWQRQNGYNIALFLLQCCVVFDSVLRKDNKVNLKKLEKEVRQIKSSLKQIPQNIATQIIAINQIINKYLPLKSIQCPEFTQQQMQQIKDYFLQKLIEGPEQNKFILKILDNIEVTDEEEQKQLSNKVQVTKFIIKDYIQEQFRYYQHIGKHSSQKDFKQQKNFKHFTSADTALDTYDTMSRARIEVQKYGIHFCMDSDFLSAASCVLLSQIERLQQVIDQQAKKNSEKTIQSKKITEQQIRSQRQLHYTHASIDTKQNEQLMSPTRIFNNPKILQNIIKVFENSIKKIIFKKLKSHKLIQNFCTKFQNSLANYFSIETTNAFNIIRSNYVSQKNLLENFKHKKLLKILKAWKNIKRRKMKLLKNMVKRKIKGDNFMLAITLTKWKMNSRSQKIKRMASAVLLGPRIQSIPKSKKGIDLAYRRTTANKQARLL